jgi:hypothetical protein
MRNGVESGGGFVEADWQRMDRQGIFPSPSPSPPAYGPTAFRGDGMIVRPGFKET